MNEQRLDHDIICQLILQGTKVLDLGCGNGSLLKLLRDKKKVNGQGIDVNESAIFQCVEKGLSVFHLDFDVGLSSFTTASFDYVILNQSLQETLHVERVIKESLRVGKNVIIGFPNFAHIKARIQLFFGGAAPVTNALPHHWYNTPNLHFLSIRDFEQYAIKGKIEILQRYYFSKESMVNICPNLLAMNAIYKVSGTKKSPVRS